MERDEAGGRSPALDEDDFTVALLALDARLQVACATKEEWPAKVGAGVYAGVDYLVEVPAAARVLFDRTKQSALGSQFRRVVQRIGSLLQEVVPAQSRPTAGMPVASIAGIALLVGEHARLDRLERLSELRPEMHLLVLLPYLGFEESQRWVAETQAAARSS